MYEHSGPRTTSRLSYPMQTKPLTVIIVKPLLCVLPAARGDHAGQWTPRCIQKHFTKWHLRGRQVTQQSHGHVTILRGYTVLSMRIKKDEAAYLVARRSLKSCFQSSIRSKTLRFYFTPETIAALKYLCCWSFPRYNIIHVKRKVICNHIVSGIYFSQVNLTFYVNVALFINAVIKTVI